jgi:hypothetical protein
MISRRKYLQALLGSSAILTGCSGQKKAELEHQGFIEWDESVVEGQPTDLSETWAWITFTTDPDSVKKLVDWELILGEFGMDAPPANNFYKFEEGTRCFVAVVANHSQPGWTADSVDQSDADMFSTGELDFRFIEENHEREMDYIYDFTLWEVGSDVGTLSVEVTEEYQSEKSP